MQFSLIGDETEKNCFHKNVMNKVIVFVSDMISYKAELLFPKIMTGRACSRRYAVRSSLPNKP